MGKYTIPPGIEIAGYYGPYEGGAFDRIDERFQEKQYVLRPVDSEFLDSFSEHLFPFLRKKKIDHAYCTSDGRLWTVITVLFGNDDKYKILFPRHEHGKTTGHVALYANSETMPDEAEIVRIKKAILWLFNEELRDYYWHKLA